MALLALKLFGRGPRPSHGPQADAGEGVDLEALLRRYTIFENVEPQELRNLAPAVRIKRFRDEEIVCHCPDATHDAFVLLNGVVAVTKKKGDAVHVVSLEGQGAVFNLGPLVGLDADWVGARALESVQLLAIDSAMLSRMLEGKPRLGYRLTRNLLRLALDQCDRFLQRYLN